MTLHVSIYLLTSLFDLSIALLRYFGLLSHMGHYLDPAHLSLPLSLTSLPLSLSLLPFFGLCGSVSLATVLKPVGHLCGGKPCRLRQLSFLPW